MTSSDWLFWLHHKDGFNTWLRITNRKIEKSEDVMRFFQEYLEGLYPDAGKFMKE